LIHFRLVIGIEFLIYCSFGRIFWIAGQDVGYIGQLEACATLGAGTAY